MSLETPITSSGFSEPSITLKRGKVEIKVNNASAIVQRMEELFPKPKGYGYSWYSHTKTTEQRLLDHDRNKALVVAAKNWFKQELYGTNEDDFEILITENNSSTPLEETKQTTPFAEEKEPIVMPIAPPTQTPIIEKTVNKNAYEIRESILIQAIDVVKYSLNDKCDTDVMTSKILDVASKFYEFVENKKSKKY